MREDARRSRRAVLAAGSAGAAGLAAALAGCQVYGQGEDPPPAGPPAGAGDGAGTVLASTGDVAVGGGLVLADQLVVITQPAAGEFRGFSAVCTHLGCTVSSVTDGTINCPCHGSRFSIEDGSVVQPASGNPGQQQDPLPEVPITVTGESIELA